MKGEKRFLSRIAALLALLLALSAVSACGKDENSSEDEDAAARLQQILSDPWYYTDDVPVEFDQPVSDLIKKDGGFEYEKEEFVYIISCVCWVIYTKRGVCLWC